MRLMSHSPSPPLVLQALESELAEAAAANARWKAALESSVALMREHGAETAASAARRAEVGPEGLVG